MKIFIIPSSTFPSASTLEIKSEKCNKFDQNDKQADNRVRMVIYKIVSSIISSTVFLKH